MRIIKFLTSLLFCLASALSAQEVRGTILGRVTDPTGGVVAGARVRAVNIDSNVAIPAETNSEGNYEAPYLLPGRYRVVVESAGFKTAIREIIEVRVADRLSVDVQLEVGDVAESVVVTGEAPLIDTASASVGKVSMKDSPASRWASATLFSTGICMTCPSPLRSAGRSAGSTPRLASNGRRPGSSAVTFELSSCASVGYGKTAATISTFRS